MNQVIFINFQAQAKARSKLPTKQVTITILYKIKVQTHAEV